jgi:hypothetical protein
MTRYIFFTVLLSLLLSFLSLASDKKTELSFETGFQFFSGKNTPFWLFSNRYDKFPLNDNIFYFDFLLLRKPDRSKFIDYGFGTETDIFYINTLDFRFQQIFGEIKLWKFILKAGKFEEKYGEQDSILTSGNILYSANARPMPKIILKSDDFIPVPFTKGYIELKGHIAHGWFDNTVDVKNFYLHSKDFYVRLGGKLPVNIYGGLAHFAQWGGISSNPRFDTLPSDFRAFKHIFFAESGDAGTVDTGEVINRLGNHIGSWNAGLIIKTKLFSSHFYFQSVFEDNSGRKFANFPDGLWGCLIKLNNKYLKALSYEYLYTMLQSGDPKADTVPKWYTGNDNYFSHWIYTSGWSYYKQTIGTPFISSPIYNICNNRVKAHNLSVMANYNEYRFLLFISYYKNYGSYNYPIDPAKNQFSLMIEASKRMKKMPFIEVSARIGADFGKMYGENFGINFSLRKVGPVIFNNKKFVQT